MSGNRAGTRQIAASERGRIVQHVLVDGWSVGEAAAAFGVAEQRVTSWVAAYRRHGMASLRDAAATERVLRRWLWQLRIMRARFAAELRACLGGSPDADRGRAVRLLRRDGEPKRLGETSDRRSSRN